MEHSWFRLATASTSSASSADIGAMDVLPAWYLRFLSRVPFPMGTRSPIIPPARLARPPHRIPVGGRAFFRDGGP